jgi:hypothetical protein
MTIHDQKLTEFLKRIPHGAPSRIATAFAIVATAREKIAAIRADAKLTRDGQNAAIAAALAKGPLPHMRQLKSGVERDLGGIQTERDGMRRRVTEANEYTEGQKAEMRVWLRSQTEQQRIELVHTTKDNRIIESITTAPHYLSGLNEEFWNALTGRIIDDRNDTRLAELVVMEESFSGASAAIKVATADMKRESGLGETEFETLVE